MPWWESIRFTKTFHLGTSSATPLDFLDATYRFGLLRASRGRVSKAPRAPPAVKPYRWEPTKSANHQLSLEIEIEPDSSERRMSFQRYKPDTLSCCRSRDNSTHRIAPASHQNRRDICTEAAKNPHEVTKVEVTPTFYKRAFPRCSNRCSSIPSVSSLANWGGIRSQLRLATVYDLLDVSNTAD